VTSLELFPVDWREVWQDHAETESVGAIFTKPEIVNLILDLAGYSPAEARLIEQRVLEPSCGDGAFILAVVTRMIESETTHAGVIEWDQGGFDDALRAVDINTVSVRAARTLVSRILIEAGCPQPRATELAQKWVIQSDFLLKEWDERFDLVVGNPPYVRIENLPKRVLERYRSEFSTLTDRADLYVAFFEQGLRLLSSRGTLAYITANRFTKNTYGAGLRKLITDSFRVRFYVNLEHTQPFLTHVSAYPAIVVVDRQRGRSTKAGTLEDVESETLEKVRRQSFGRAGKVIESFRSWFPEGAPWSTTSAKEQASLSRLAATLPTLELSAPGTRVGIGVATGADKVFVLEKKHEEIEESRQIPLLMASNVYNDRLDWSGRYLVNPFVDEGNGNLVELSDYPGLAEYLQANFEALHRRHVAKARPRSWYRTIDRIWPDLVHRPKLVIPDIQGSTVIGYDDGQFYPHHNLYWITSESWPLLALKAMLRSSIVYEQVRAYSVQMRGGSVRFQAQTLRKIRLPFLKELSDSLLERLVEASEGTQSEVDDVAAEIYGNMR
jgi:methylase of polypeptide subunit release factors